MGNSPGSRANNIYSHGRDETDVRLCVSTSCQPGSRVIRAFSDIEKIFLFSGLAVKDAKSENTKGFSTSEKTWISSRVNNFIDTAAGEKATSNNIRMFLRESFLYI